MKDLEATPITDVEGDLSVHVEPVVVLDEVHLVVHVVVEGVHADKFLFFK